jgi:hypothetical protein
MSVVICSIGAEDCILGISPSTAPKGSSTDILVLNASFMVEISRFPTSSLPVSSKLLDGWVMREISSPNASTSNPEPSGIASYNSFFWVTAVSKFCMTALAIASFEPLEDAVS